MQTTGQILQEARERKGVSLSQAARDTKVKLDYLASLEADELERLIAPVYAKSFLRMYADYLGLDAKLLSSPKTVAKEPPPAPPPPPEPPPERIPVPRVKSVPRYKAKPPPPPPPPPPEPEPEPEPQPEPEPMPELPAPVAMDAAPEEIAPPAPKRFAAPSPPRKAGPRAPRLPISSPMPKQAIVLGAVVVVVLVVAVVLFSQHRLTPSEGHRADQHGADLLKPNPAEAADIYEAPRPPR